MTTETPQQLRKSSKDFAIKAYKEMKHNRIYAMTAQAADVVASLARAMFVKREIEGRRDSDGKSPSAFKEFHGIVESLARAGCNIVQARPNESPAIPALWINPLTNQPLPPPKGVDERSLLQKLDPDLLQMFDRLEKEPYRVVQQMREDEATRAALSAVEYDENTHHANPWRRGDQTAMADLVKRDPVLAQFCQQEAKDVQLNLFGQGRDLTIRGKLFKDPEAASIVELGEKIIQLWRQEDRAAAATQRAAAEAKLAELAASDAPAPPRMAQRVRLGAE